MSTSPVKAIFSDLDGTLLDPHHKINEYTQNVIRRLKAEQNIYFVVATGRPYADVLPKLRDVNLEPDYIITSNGARVHDKDFKEIIRHDIDIDAVRETLTKAQEFGVASEKEIEEAKSCPKCRIPSVIENRKYTSNLYREAEWLTDIGISAIAAAYHPSFQYQELGGQIFRLPDDQLTGIHELFFLGDGANLVPLKTHLDTHLKDKITCTYSLPYILDCVPAHVNKGTALKEVAGRLGLTAADVCAFGDGMNDEKMLQTAAHSFVMANGNPDLFEAVPNAVKIGSNAEDGVAKQLEKMFFS